ncbi:MAG: endonuclease/exonuclease/phosphatase family metal-dependent hydrolase [Psychromonas sp.]|jgi:endonuclease/exonuclease/phosphatase family metal-dependent hydrolase
MRILLLFLLYSIQGISQDDVKVMTFNIRYATPSDGINQWENRKEKVAQTISYYESDIAGLQEATEPQVLFLAKRLENYNWVGVGRDDGKTKGEFAPIFYNKDRLELVEWSTIWLSKTPEVPSKDWDAALPRIATIAYLKCKSDGLVFVVINTHYDHKGEIARVESSKLISRIVNDLKDKFKVVLLGDFNSTPKDEAMLTYAENGLDNTQDISKTGHFGPIDTFTGFNSVERPDSQIDHILVSPKIKVKSHATISQSWNGLYASDHHAIFAILSF